MPVDRKLAVRAAVEELLTPRQAEVIRLIYRDRLDVQEVAEQLGIDPGTVLGHLSRGRRKIGRFLLLLGVG